MTRADVRRSLVTDDITDDKRRAKLAKILSEFGDRLQYSVFVIDATPTGIVRLRTRVLEAINGYDDSVLMCDLGLLAMVSDRNFTYLGVRREFTTVESFLM